MIHVCAGPYRFSSASVASSSNGGPSFATDGDTDVADALGTIASVQSSLAAKLRYISFAS